MDNRFENIFSNRTNNKSPDFSPYNKYPNYRNDGLERINHNRQFLNSSSYYGNHQSNEFLSMKTHYDNVTKYKPMRNMLYQKEEIKKQEPEISLINNNNIDELNNYLKKLVNIIGLSLNKIEIIDIEKIKEECDKILKKIEKYNNIITNWYDDKFYSDKQIFEKNMENEQKKSFSFNNNDFIIIK